LAEIEIPHAAMRRSHPETLFAHGSRAERQRLFGSAGSIP
jgi:hypothetical protein